MKVGVYVDGLNLYYGGRSHFGRATPGWRWLDLRQLSERLLARRSDWLKQGALLQRVVYCTAFIDGNIHPAEHQRQQVYVAALKANRSFDHLEKGRFTARWKTGLLATRDRNGRPVVHTSRWPLMVQDGTGAAVHDARFMVSYLSLNPPMGFPGGRSGVVWGWWAGRFRWCLGGFGGVVDVV